MNQIIFISNSLADISKAKEFSKKRSYNFQHYSLEEWRKKTGKHKKYSSKRESFKTTRAEQPPPSLSIVPFPANKSLKVPTMHETKINATKNALLRARGNATHAAQLLNIGRATLYRQIREWDIDLESIRYEVEEKAHKTQTLQKVA